MHQEGLFNGDDEEEYFVVGINVQESWDQEGRIYRQTKKQLGAIILFSTFSEPDKYLRGSLMDKREKPTKGVMEGRTKE